MKYLSFSVAICGIALINSFTNIDQISVYHKSDGIEVVNFSVNPPVAKTGAPGEFNCTECHSGAVQSATGNVNLAFDGSGEYLLGQTYSFTISGVAAAAKNGFELTILDLSDVKAGDLTAGTNSNVITSGGRQYIRQSASSGVSSWTFNWTAPTTDVGDLVVYYSFNQTNNDGSTTGDVIFLGEMNITSAVANEIEETGFELPEYNIVYEGASIISIRFKAPISENLNITLTDLSGKIAVEEQIAPILSGQPQIDLVVPETLGSGLYILSISSIHSSVSEKIYLGH